MKETIKQAFEESQINLISSILLSCFGSFSVIVFAVLSELESVRSINASESFLPQCQTPRRYLSNSKPKPQ